MGICIVQRIFFREKRLNNPDTYKGKDQRYYAKNKTEILEKRKNWLKQNPHKKTAHNQVRNAVKSKVIAKQPCEVCGNVIVDAHHDDYKKPLIVRWLCKRHHRLIH